MKLLAFCLLLGMSAPAQVTNLSATTEQPQTFLSGYTISDDCSFGQKIEISRGNGDKEILATCGTDGKWWKFRDETDFAEAAQRAADETDGKPLSKLRCTVDAVTHKISPPECADETGPLGDGPNPPWPPAEKILWIDPKVDPHKPWDEVDGQDWPRKSVPADPVDVPAVPHKHIIMRNLGTCSNSWAKCIPGRDVTQTIWTCADKSRILEHDENSPPKYWCRKVQP